MLPPCSQVKDFILEQKEAYEFEFKNQKLRRPGDPPLPEPEKPEEPPKPKKSKKSKKAKKGKKGKKGGAKEEL